MNITLWIFAAVPVAWLIYRIGAARGRILADHYDRKVREAYVELERTADMYDDIVDEWSNACIVLDQVNRRLGNCVCGNRLTQEQEQEVMSVLIEASIVDPADGAA
jgi:thymidylate kinase